MRLSQKSTRIEGDRPWPNALTHIGYANFKAFAHLDLDIRPITVFLGPNNSGKSSILAGPKLLTQTTESFDSNVTLLLNGIFGDYGTYRDVVFGNRRRRSMEISMSLRYSRETFSLASSESGNQQPVSSTLRLKYKYRSNLKQIILAEIEVTSGDICLLKTKFSETSERPLVTRLGDKIIAPQSRASLSRRLRLQHFLPRNIAWMFSADRTRAAGLNSKVDRHVRDLQRMGVAFYRFFDELEYVGAIRAAPARTFLFSGETRARVGANGEHAINIMLMDSLRSEKRSLGIQNRVVAWLKRAKVAGDVRVQSLSDRHYEIHIKHPITGEYSNFADVGYGNSQVIPVLVAGYNLRRGGTLLVEQPEIHLHPRAQAELGDFFLELYKRRVQSFVETHSEHLVLRLQQHVAKGMIPAKDVVFYYVHAKGKNKRATKMTLDGQGRFVEAWPEGFFPERLEEAKNLARARYPNS